MEVQCDVGAGYQVCGYLWVAVWGCSVEDLDVSVRCVSMFWFEVSLWSLNSICKEWAVSSDRLIALEPGFWICFYLLWLIICKLFAKVDVLFANTGNSLKLKYITVCSALFVWLLKGDIMLCLNQILQVLIEQPTW